MPVTFVQGERKTVQKASFLRKAVSELVRDYNSHFAIHSVDKGAVVMGTGRVHTTDQRNVAIL